MKCRWLDGVLTLGRSTGSCGTGPPRTPPSSYLRIYLCSIFTRDHHCVCVCVCVCVCRRVSACVWACVMYSACVCRHIIELVSRFYHLRTTCTASPMSVACSWGTYWGESGFFRIKMHSDNLAIETDCDWGMWFFSPDKFGNLCFHCFFQAYQAL